MPDNPTPAPQVRVVCQKCGGTGKVQYRAAPHGDVLTEPCPVLTCCGGVYLATLADPSALSLMEDGRRWRAHWAMMKRDWPIELGDEPTVEDLRG